MQNIIRRGQSLIDVVIQECGSVESLFDIAIKNDLSPTENLCVGQSIQSSSEDVIEKQIVSHYTNRGIVPATKIDQDKSRRGIGSCRIGEFIIG